MIQGEPQFFKNGAELRKWFAKNHDKATELWLGYYKTDTGKPSVTWPESGDEALCFGWIDGVRKSLGEESYMIRFTKRKPASIWSAVNIAKVEALKKAGLMMPEGLAAYEKLKEHKSAIYTYEKEASELSKEYIKLFKADKAAWAYFEQQAPWYRKQMIHRVMDAKQAATRDKRMAKLIQYSREQKRMP